MTIDDGLCAKIDILQRVVFEDNEPAGGAVLSEVYELGGYSWLQARQPTIAVP
ncbi:hypothetical protein LTR12_018161, partial [Friedmanniomyces endolithicus]